MTDPPFLTRLRPWARPTLAIYWVLLAALTHWPRLHFGTTEVVVKEFVNPDKLVHFTAFFGLTLLLWYSSVAGRYRSGILNLYMAGILAGTYAPIDEVTQAFAAERTPAWDDMLADLAGVASVLLIAMVLNQSSSRTSKGTLAARLLLAVLLPLAMVMFLLPGFPHDIPIGEFKRLANFDLPAVFKQLRVDWLGHGLIAALLTALLLGAKVAGAHRRWLSGGLALCLSLMFITTIEAAQLRSAPTMDWADINAHLLGMVLGVIIWLIMKLATVSVAKPRAERVSDSDVAKIENQENIARSTSHTSAATDVEDDETEPDAQTKTPANAGNAAPSEKSGRFVGHAMLVAALTLVSRMTGLVRDAVLAAAFGLGAASDAFFIGFLVPNLFRRLFGEGALTAAFVPIYTRLLHKDAMTARRFASLCIALLVILLGALTLIGEAVLAWLIHRHTWSTESDLALRMTMIMLPFMPLICATALLGAIMQVRDRFGPSATAPIVLNIVLICGALLAGHGVIGDGSMEQVLRVAGFSVLIAGVIQVVWHVLVVLRLGALARSWQGAWPHIRNMLLVMGPMVIGLAVFQINTMLDSLIAFFLSPKDGNDALLHIGGITTPYPIEQGGVAALQWAQRLYQFPLGVFGIAIATAIFPTLSRAAAGDDAISRERLTRTLQQGLRLTAFIGIPATIGLILVRVPLSRVIYERGRFELDDALRVATILTGYAAAVWAYSMSHVITRAFFAMKDSRTPLLISVAMVSINLLLNAVLVWPLGAAGLAWSSAVCAVGQLVLLLVAMRNYVSQPLSRDVWISWGKSLLVSGCMAAFLIPFLLWRDPATSEWTGALEQLITMVIAGMLVYVVGSAALDAKELKWLRTRRIDD